jgi:hypothetical protein
MYWSTVHVFIHACRVYLHVYCEYVYSKFLVKTKMYEMALSPEDGLGGYNNFPVSMQNHKALRSTNIFKMSHNKQSHKVKVLARIYLFIYLFIYFCGTRA